MSRLKAIEPKITAPSKPKILIFGKSGAGKTWQAIDWPDVYYIDTEAGADLAHYQEKLAKVGGMYFGPEQGSQEPSVIIDQFRGLATEKHRYKTVVVDSISKIFNKIAAEESDRLTRAGEDDGYGRANKPAVRFVRQIMGWVDRIKMNVIFVAHEKDEYKGGQCIGVTFDAWPKLEYELHLALQIRKEGTSRKAFTRKSRLTGFPENEIFPWSYEEFAKRYGRDVMEAASEPIEVASSEQVTRALLLQEQVRLPADELEKWFTKAGVTGWGEMNPATIAKCITALEARMK